MLTSHRQKYNPKKPIAKIIASDHIIQAFDFFFEKKNQDTQERFKWKNQSRKNGKTTIGNEQGK